MTPEEAVAEVGRKFPIQNYVAGNLAPWLTVGEVIKQHTAPGDLLFDFGSGGCDKTAVAQLLGCKCTATDDLADDWYQRGDVRQKIENFASDMGIEFSLEFPAIESGSFDIVMMNDVLEHIADSPRELLNTLVDGLKTDGLLFITVPNLANMRKRIDLLRGRTNLPDFDLYYWYRGTWRGPRREYVRGDLEAMCAHLGVEIVELRTVHHMIQNLPSSLRGPYRAVTSILSDWRDTWLLIARKPSGWTSNLDVADERFAEIYGRKGYTALYGDESRE